MSRYYRVVEHLVLKLVDKEQEELGEAPARKRDPGPMLKSKIIFLSSWISELQYQRC